MNRVLGDYMEELLYKIFVSIDEHTTVAELASVLRIGRPKRSFPSHLPAVAPKFFI